METYRHNIDYSTSDKVTWLAKQIFKSFPQDVAGLKFHALDCGCIYYQRVFRNGALDPQVGIYRDAEDGLCEVCMHLEKGWEVRVLDEIVIYNYNFQVEKRTKRVMIGDSIPKFQ